MRFDTLPLGDLCSSIEDGDWIESKDQGGEDFRLLQVGNVGVGVFRETGNYRFVSAETFGRLRCRELRVGDVLVSRMPDPVGRAWHIRRALPWKSITAVDVAIVSPNPAKLDPAYCAYFLNSPQNLDHARARAGGTTRLRITRRDLATFPIPVPPLAEQRRIASILSAYDDLIENNTRRIAILEEMARRIYEEWFVRFRFPGHQGVRMVASELGLVPEGWPVVRIDDVLVLQRGFDLPKQDRTEGPFPIVSATGVSGSHHEHRVKGAGVVTGRSGSLGTVIYVEGDFWPLNTTLWVKHFRVGSPLYAYYVLTGIDLAGFNSGAAVPTLNRNDVHGLPTTKPPEELLRRFDEVAGPMIKLKRRLELSNIKLRDTRDLLLPKLISGELDVSAMPEPDAVAA